MSDECIKGALNEQAIKALNERLDCHDIDSKEVRARIFNAVDDLKNNYIKTIIKIADRPPVWATTTITILTALLSSLVVYAFIR